MFYKHLLHGFKGVEPMLKFMIPSRCEEQKPRVLCREFWSWTDYEFSMIAESNLHDLSEQHLVTVR